MVTLKAVDPKSAYMDAKNLVPIWKREIALKKAMEDQVLFQ